MEFLTELLLEVDHVEERLLLENLGLRGKEVKLLDCQLSQECFNFLRIQLNLFLEQKSKPGIYAWIHIIRHFDYWLIKHLFEQDKWHA